VTNGYPTCALKSYNRTRLIPKTNLQIGDGQVLRVDALVSLRHLSSGTRDPETGAVNIRERHSRTRAKRHGQCRASAAGGTAPSGAACCKRSANNSITQPDDDVYIGDASRRDARLPSTSDMLTLFLPVFQPFRATFKAPAKPDAA